VSTRICSRCGAPRELDDNYCRRCGRQLTVELPAITQSRLPARSQPIPPSLVGSVAVLALGTGIEWLARRLAGSAARAAGRALVGQDRQVSPAGPPQPPPVETTEELVYLRRVRLRR